MGIKEHKHTYVTSITIPDLLIKTVSTHSLQTPKEHKGKKAINLL